MNSTLLPWEEYERGSDVQYEEHQSSTHIEKSSDTKVLQEEPQHREFVASEHFTVNAPQLHRATKEHKALPKHGTLFIVSTPIGNNDDISLRALKTLKTADVVVGEEGKTAARLLHDNRISKKLEELNEHNEHEQTPRLLQLLKSGKTLALVSDAGTPLLADPGAQLVRKAIEAGISVRAVPGVTSIMAALTTSGLPMDSFVFAGFLSREPAERLQELKRLAQEPRTVVVLETPYRLVPLLEAARQIIPQRRAYLGCNLTMESETHHYGTVSELYTKFVVSRFKGEFVFCFEGLQTSQQGAFATPSPTSRRKEEPVRRAKDIHPQQPIAKAPKKQHAANSATHRKKKNKPRKARKNASYTQEHHMTHTSPKETTSLGESAI